MSNVLDAVNTYIVLKNMQELEGYTVEEAKLSYQERKDLPKEAFCGPGRSYPANDAVHVRNGLARLGTFGGKLSPKVRARILGCLKSRAKKYGIEVSEAEEMSIMALKEEKSMSDDEWIKWYDSLECATC
jgi:hypothetical protein